MALMTILKQKLTQLALKVLIKLEPNYERPVLMHVTPPNALQYLVQSIDKKFGSAWDKTPVPTDDIETIMYRSGAKSYREQLLKEIHATSQANFPQGLRHTDT